MGRVYWIVRWALHAITNVLVRRRQRESTDRRKGKMTTEAERRATHPQAKEFQPPEAGRGREQLLLRAC